MEDGSEPIASNEILYRRVPAKPDYYDPNREIPLTILAFRPTKADTSGLSLFRAKYTSPQDCARLGPGVGYYIVKFPAADLVEQRIRVEPRPTEKDPGHLELPELTYERRSGSREEGIQLFLAHNSNNQVLGPFPGGGADSATMAKDDQGPIRAA